MSCVVIFIYFLNSYRLRNFSNSGVLFIFLFLIVAHSLVFARTHRLLLLSVFVFNNLRDFLSIDSVNFL